MATETNYPSGRAPAFGGTPTAGYVEADSIYSIDKQIALAAVRTEVRRALERGQPIRCQRIA